MAQPFQDHFGAVSRRYAVARPTYPDELFAWLATAAPVRRRAWDCGAGSGQASVALAAHFDEVVATDASAGQLAEAITHPRVVYRVAPAEASGLEDASVDLVTVAQALHWFPVDAFYAEVRRVARPGAVISAWTYAAFTIASPEADAIVRTYHYETMADWWPPERMLVENGYRDVPFPFERIDVPAFLMQTSWTLAQVTAYLRSWSATARYAAAHCGADPVASVEAQLRDVWGDPSTPLSVTWPLTVLAGRVS
ncbi:MAG TPA: methyltransferase domain-containing protein [Luteitalea sp.]|nr:methyltransferase domain-containing protein [Luteitalea sp.]